MDALVDLVKGLPLGGIGFAGLVTLAIILIFRGEIVPKSTVDSMRRDRDTMISVKDAEIEMVKEAYRLSEKARATSSAADIELLELGRTTVHLLQAIHERAEGVTR